MPCAIGCDDMLETTDNTGNILCITSCNTGYYDEDKK